MRLSFTSDFRIKLRLKFECQSVRTFLPRAAQTQQCLYAGFAIGATVAYVTANKTTIIIIILQLQ